MTRIVFTDRLLPCECAAVVVDVATSQRLFESEGFSKNSFRSEVRSQGGGKKSNCLRQNLKQHFPASNPHLSNLLSYGAYLDLNSINESVRFLVCQTVHMPSSSAYAEQCISRAVQMPSSAKASSAFDEQCKCQAFEFQNRAPFFWNVFLAPAPTCKKKFFIFQTEG